MSGYDYRYVCKTPLGLRGVLVAADSDEEADARFLGEFPGGMGSVLYVERSLSAERDGRLCASRTACIGSRGRRSMGRVSLALVAVAAYAAVTLLLYVLIVRWPWLMVAYLAVALACAALSLAAFAALLVARSRRGGRE